jgi:hypothetical protein
MHIFIPQKVACYYYLQALFVSSITINSLVAMILKKPDFKARYGTF